MRTVFKPVPTDEEFAAMSPEERDSAIAAIRWDLSCAGRGRAGPRVREAQPDVQGQHPSGRIDTEHLSAP
ncbi:hypothetical protein D3C72_2518170 [compost metagenome]